MALAMSSVQSRLDGERTSRAEDRPTVGAAGEPNTISSAEQYPLAAVRFDDRPLKEVRTVQMLVTAYSPDPRSCGKWADGVTASGRSIWTNGMKLVAADTGDFPFHTILTIPGYNRGQPVQVLDRGGGIKGDRLDVLMPSHAAARRWGTRRLDVTVWRYADVQN